MSKVLNAIKGGYLAAVQWIDDHPHAALWLATGVLIAVLVLA